MAIMMATAAKPFVTVVPCMAIDDLVLVILWPIIVI